MPRGWHDEGIRIAVDPRSKVKSYRPPWSATRLWRGLLFLGIVWSIAGAFLVLQNVLPELFVRAVGTGWIAPELTVNRSLKEEAALRCNDDAGETRVVTDPAALQSARYMAFRMGTGFGVAAGTASMREGRAESAAPLLNQVRAQAEALGVPPPELPAIRHLASALVEFSDELEADRQCTAFLLARRYTPIHSDIFRFGSVVGYAALLCVNDACGAHGSEIRRYGQAADLPQRLWLPLAQGSLDSIPGADAREKTLRVLADLDEHIRMGR